MDERRARRTVTRREGGGRRPLTTAVFTPITGEPFPLFPAVSLYRETGMGHPDTVHPPPTSRRVTVRLACASVRVHEQSRPGTPPPRLRRVRAFRLRGAPR